MTGTRKIATDSRPTLRAVTREQRAIDAQINGKRHERYLMEYLLGMNAALLWMSNKNIAPPSVMFAAARDMLQHEQLRRKATR